MNSVFRGNNRNTGVTKNPFTHIHTEAIPFLVFSQGTGDVQSASVSASSFLWWRRLAQIAHEDLLASRQNDLDEIRQSSVSQPQKNQALLQALRSWREGDEQEQKETWSYLKQALDEDRTSERKLFP